MEDNNDVNKSRHSENKKASEKGTPKHSGRNDQDDDNDEKKEINNEKHEQSRSQSKKDESIHQSRVQGEPENEEENNEDQRKEVSVRAPSGKSMKSQKAPPSAKSNKAPHAKEAEDQPEGEVNGSGEEEEKVAAPSSRQGGSRKPSAKVLDDDRKSNANTNKEKSRVMDDEQQDLQDDPEIKPKAAKAPTPKQSQVVTNSREEPLPKTEEKRKKTTTINEETKNSKTFLTQPKGGAKTEVQPWHLYDMLFPGGKPAKLCKILDPESRSIGFQEILNRFKVDDGLPVIVLSGARNSNRGKFLAGIARAAFRTDAVIIDSGLFTGIEMFTMRKNVKLIGVAPEGEILYPKINPTVRDPNELSNGHTHLFLLCNTDKKKYNWSDEASFKYHLANNIALGKASKKSGRPRCKIVYVILGDHTACDDDIFYAVQNHLPIIVVSGSSYCEKIIKYMSKETEDLNLSLSKQLLEEGHIYILDNNNSEEIASYLHFFLTYTPYDIPKK